jgi:hypothetical protein
VLDCGIADGGAWKEEDRGVTAISLVVCTGARNRKLRERKRVAAATGERSS